MHSMPSTDEKPVAQHEDDEPRLIIALHSRDPYVRWHAAKALRERASPRSVGPLIAALEDEDAGVRWEAMHGLVAIGLPALAPLLHVLSTKELSVWLATGAQRVLRRLAPLVPDLRLERLIRLLGDRQAYISAPLEAHRLLLQMTAEQTTGS